MMLSWVMLRRRPDVCRAASGLMGRWFDVLSGQGCYARFF
ncbi:hypothetical protein NY78_0942 [Desulfovibrio sp. TomC]|nr:hypothetical protein NY78_0942 [Desulfovibrio sp. TomC]